MASISDRSSVTLSIVMPAYNEEHTIASVIQRVLEEVSCDFELVIVNDGSKDQTGRIIEEFAAKDSRIRTHHKDNGGKASALKQGFAMTRGEIVIIQDADLEYDPSEIVHVIQPILDKKADVVFGSRFLVRRAARVLYFYHYVANRFITILSNFFTNLNMTDVETGYKAIRGQIIRDMVITSSGFGIEIEITAKVAKLGAAVYEVPISYYGRTYEEGKKIGFWDGVMALWYIVYYNLMWNRANSFQSGATSSASSGKGTTGIATILLLVSFLNLSWTLRESIAFDLHGRDAMEARLSSVEKARQRLASEGLTHAGYIAVADETASQEFFRIQDVIAPVILRRGSTEDEIVLADYSKSQAQPELEGFSMMEDLGNGLALFKRP